MAPSMVTWKGLAFPSLLLMAAAMAARHCDNQSTITDPRAFGAITYDYLIIGGGTAGLAVASRLAEDSRIQVGVIEAGDFHPNDPLVDIPTYPGPGSALGNTSYDWSFVTTPQMGASGRSIVMQRGKLLGGSSALNNLAWTRASKTEYDAWQHFAQNDRWNWDGILPYMKKSAAVFPRQDNVPGVSHAAYDPRYEGFKGPVSASFNTFYSDPFPLYLETLNAAGIETNASPDDGDNSGSTNSRSDVDRSTGTRAYAAPAYFCPSAAKTNFHVLTGAQATKIFLKPAEGGHTDVLEATGVQYSSGSHLYTAKATRDIILSAGAYQSPQLLELSGIGNRTLLEGLGINTLIDLPAVGENLQDHLLALVQYRLKPGIQTFDDLRINKTFATEQAALYAKNGSGILSATDSALAFLPPSSFLSATAIESLQRTFDRVVTQGNPSPLQKMQFDVQREWLHRGTVPQVELIMWSHGVVNLEDNETYISVIPCGLHHLYRGSVHINTSAPLAHPVIDAAWLTNDFDVMIILEGLKFVQSLGKIKPLANIVDALVSPPPNLQTDEALIDYIRKTVLSASHPMGTAAMGPQALGGVVDGDLKVYGTTNLRVCDASIFPTSIGTHLQSTVYAIAEMLADTLKEARLR